MAKKKVESTPSIQTKTKSKRSTKSKKNIEEILDDAFYDDEIEDTSYEENMDDLYEEEYEDSDEITDEEVKAAQEIENLSDFENFEDDFENMDMDVDLEDEPLKKGHKRVYKTSNKSEDIRQRFVGICERYQSDDPEIKKDALNEAINELKSFVHYIIKKKYSTYGKHYEDLVQEGIIGIMKGMEKYDPAKSLPTTFFNLYIIHEMSKYIDTEVNKTTSHYSSNLTKINRVIDRLEQQGKKWTENDIAIETGLNMETVIQCLNIKEYKNEMYYETDEILEANISEHSKSPETQYLENEKLAVLYKSIGTLLPEEIQVLQYRYGLAGTETISYKEIAKEMNISIEKVRKYRHDAIRKLRHKAQMRNVFRDYIYDGENNSINETDVSFIPEELANNMMKEIEEIDFDFEQLLGD